MRNYSLLPVKEIKIPCFSHFPTKMQLAVFRMWETVKAERISEVLEISLDKIYEIANDMGLPPQKNMDKWQERGYITTIRNLWHILPYNQLLKVLDWTEEKLASTLQNDDFLYVKLGRFKPKCDDVCYEELTDSQKEQTKKIKEIIEKNFSGMFNGAVPFDFFGEDTEHIETFEHNGETINLIYSFCGLYANALDVDTAISYPDALLLRYSKMGINAIWLPAVLYQLTEFPFEPSYSEGYKERQNRLRELIERAKKYGIKVILYLNEPRGMPLEFFEKHPELKGAYTETAGALCTAVPGVLEYLKNAVRELCEAVHGIGGFYMINFSENLTHCKSIYKYEECPNCKDIPPEKIVADILNTIAEAAGGVDPDIRIIAYTWVWTNYMDENGIKELIDALPKNVVLMCVSEAQKAYSVGGIESNIRDYSMSIPGPGEQSKWIWKCGREKGHEICAKVQINTTWECSTVPYLPVYDLICEHMKNLNEEGVTNLMLSWTLGGYPSFNLKLATEFLKNPTEETYDRVLGEEYGEYASSVKKAALKFSDAFREFPFYVTTLYRGPQNAGPSNLLYEAPTGLDSTMTCYAFDDMELWRSIYPLDVFKEQFKKLSLMWKEGLKEIEKMPDCNFKDAAYAAYSVFRSSYLQIEFNMNRENGKNTELCEIIDEEISLALMMYNIMLRNNSIGYEAANHYYFNKSMLVEKVLCCSFLKEKIMGKEQ